MCDNPFQYPFSEKKTDRNFRKFRLVPQPGLAYTDGMQVYYKQALAFIAVPKTGTTAVEQALRPHATLEMPNRFKHMTAGQFHRRAAPFLKDSMKLEPHLFAVLREPEDQLRSWYKYRQRQKLEGKPEYTGGLSFDQFVLDALSETPPPHARVGRQWNMISQAATGLAVDFLFVYEVPAALLQFLRLHFGEDLTLPARNVSPPAEAELEPSTRRRLQAERAEEYALHTRLMEEGGFLTRTPPETA